MRGGPTRERASATAGRPHSLKSDHGSGSSEGNGGFRPFRFVGRMCGHVAMLVLPLVLLVALGLGLGYVRLRHGPVSVKLLAHAIAHGIAAEMPGTQVKIDDVVISLATKSGVEFQLRNLKISEAGGDVIASAPMAAVELSASALQSFRFVPSRVDLIEPELAIGTCRRWPSRFQLFSRWR